MPHHWFRSWPPDCKHCWWSLLWPDRIQIRANRICYNASIISSKPFAHDDVIKWKHFPRYWPFVQNWRIHQSPMNSPHKGQWRGALMFSFICTWINGWVNKREAGDLRRHCTHYDVTVMIVESTSCQGVFLSRHHNVTHHILWINKNKGIWRRRYAYNIIKTDAT